MLRKSLLFCLSFSSIFLFLAHGCGEKKTTLGMLCSMGNPKPCDDGQICHNNVCSLSGSIPDAAPTDNHPPKESNPDQNKPDTAQPDANKPDTNKPPERSTPETPSESTQDATNPDEITYCKPELQDSLARCTEDKQCCTAAGSRCKQLPALKANNNVCQCPSNDSKDCPAGTRCLRFESDLGVDYFCLRPCKSKSDCDSENICCKKVSFLANSYPLESGVCAPPNKTGTTNLWAPLTRCSAELQ